MALILVLAWLLLSGALIALAFRAELARAWREPVLAAPVLILESDDWGYGPLEQAERLAAIASALARHRDHKGRPAVMTLGVVLCGPDTARIAANGCSAYRRIELSAAQFQPVRTAIESGVRAGVFAVQLHGMEHFWPEAVLAQAARDPSVRAWLTGAAHPQTERLPAALQSRWMHAPPHAIGAAATEEIKEFEATFEQPAAVAVPPTFIWTSAVEEAWAQAGVRTVITPGRRYGGRDAAGKPIADGAEFHNGQQGTHGVTYLVRDDYFEPALGHGAAQGLAALAGKTALGRPALLEIHRHNFLGEANAARSLAQMEALLAGAFERWPSLQVMSSADLAGHYRRETTLVERRLKPRLHCWLRRLARVSRLRKLAWVSGIALPAGLLWLATYRTATG